MLHCISTPLIFVMYSSLSSELSMSFSWWRNFDYIFLFISLLMVYFSARLTRVKIMKYLFWLSWGTLFFVILNEKTDLFQFSEYITYLAAIALSLLHLLNLKHCK